MIKVAVTGAAGRMGRLIVKAASEAEDVVVVSAVEAPLSAALGADAGELAGVGRLGVKVTERLEVPADVIIDFSLPAATPLVLTAAADFKSAVVMGTTGHGPTELEAIETAAREIAVLKAANMSPGVNLLLQTVEEIARTLGPAYDI